MSADEDVKMVDYVTLRMQEMRPGEVLNHPKKPKYFLYWNRLEVVWFVIIEIQPKVGRKPARIMGSLNVLDMSKGTQADRLVRRIDFNPAREMPFTLILAPDDEQAFVLRKPEAKGGVPGARVYVEAYLAHLHEIFTKASDDQVQSELKNLRAPKTVYANSQPRSTGVGSQKAGPRMFGKKKH